MEENLYLYLNHHLILPFPLEESRRVYCTIETQWIHYHTIGVSPTLQGRLFEAPSIGALPWWCKFRPWGAGGTPLPWESEGGWARIPRGGAWGETPFQWQ